MFIEGQRVRWTGLKPKLGTVAETQVFDHYVKVNWDGENSIAPSSSCPSFVELENPPILSADLCKWIIDCLLTESQLDCVRPGDAFSLRYAVYPRKEYNDA